MIYKPLSEIQAPIKKKLTEHPEEAILSLSAQAVLTDRFRWKVSEDHLDFEAGLTPAAGGAKGTANPGVVFLSSLCVCAGVTLSTVADYMGIMLHSCRAAATGLLDKRGPLGIPGTAAIGFTGIDIKFEIDSNADDGQLEDLLEAVTKYSVNCRTVSTETLVTYDIIEA